MMRGGGERKWSESVSYVRVGNCIQGTFEGDSLNDGNSDYRNQSFESA